MGEKVKKEWFNIFRSVTDCAEFVNHCHIPFIYKVHPHLDNPIGYQEGDVILMTQRWVNKRKVPN